jgi:hypothetical protein
MSRKQREIANLVEEALDGAGVLDYTFGFTGTGHQKVVFNFNGKKNMYVFPSTASDHRALKNTKAGIYRMLGLGRSRLESRK